LIVAVISVLFTAAFNEGMYLLLKEKHDRAPQRVALVIPDGTAARVEAGEDVPTIPDEMVFVIGDVLEVKNEDVVAHQLGPIWVPSGASASLLMEKPDHLAFECSFQTTRYLGIDVRQPTTLGTRMMALTLAAPTMAALLFIYSLVLFPIKPPVRISAGQTPSKSH
jgi:hypothetical protein